MTQSVDHRDLGGLPREPGVALWRQIASALESDIRQGRLGAGEQLPSEMALAARFDVNRHTVRRAIDALARERLVQVARGRGTFVHGDALEYALGKRTRFTENLAPQGDASAEAATRELLEHQRCRAGREIAHHLGLHPAHNVEVLELLGTANGRPLSLARHCFPARRFPGMDVAWQAHGSITACMAAYGVRDYLRRSTRITARSATEAESELLALPRGAPVLVTEGVNVDASGVPVEFGIARFAAQRVQLLVES